MNIRELDGRNICILGYGVEGRATHAALRHYAPHARITIADSNPALSIEANPNAKSTASSGQAATPVLITGPHYLERLAGFDAIVKSPGIPWRPTDPALRDKLTSATELFLDSLPPGATVIGITGTKGKSTTASLIYQTLIAGGKRAFLAGNIGEPMLDLLPEITPNTASQTYVVLELSSYQLESIRTSPHIAVITSFFPDHLDYHGGLQAYHEAKMNIARFQTAADVVFYNAAYPACRAIAKLSPGRQSAFGPEDYPGHENPAVRGPHNTANLAAAYLVARKCDVGHSTAVHALETAHGLPHRLEGLGVFHDLHWIDDSAANTPEATIAAIETLGKTVDTIIVGGLDRGYDLSGLSAALASSSIQTIILFPETGPKLRQLIEAAPAKGQSTANDHPAPTSPKTFFETRNMHEAVAFARTHTRKGGTVLLSNGAPSYNLFKNFTQRAASVRAAIEAK